MKIFEVTISIALSLFATFMENNVIQFIVTCSSIDNNSDISNQRNHYRPQTKLREGNVFTGVCDSVHGGVPGPGGLWFQWGGAWSGGAGPGGSGLGGVPGGDHADGYCCGRYTSYWNAFLLLIPVNISFSNTIQYVGYFIQKCNNTIQRLGVGVDASLAPKLNPPLLLNQSWHDATSTAISTFLRKSENTEFAISMLLVHVLCPGKSMTKVET